LFPFFSPKENEKVPEGEFLPLVPRRGKEKNWKVLIYIRNSVVTVV
jgi:hypothetical protein